MNQNVTRAPQNVTRRPTPRVTPHRDACAITFPQVVTHVTRTPNITENTSVTRVTRSPWFRPTRTYTYTGEAHQ